jgi:hypothetical protein
MASLNMNGVNEGSPCMLPAKEKTIVKRNKYALKYIIPH